MLYTLPVFKILRPKIYEKSLHRSACYCRYVRRGCADWKHIFMHTRVILLGQEHPRRLLCQLDGILVLQRLIQHYFRYRHHHSSDSCTEGFESTKKPEVRTNTCLHYGRIVRLLCFPRLMTLDSGVDGVFNSFAKLRTQKDY